jgi:beta-galactosidase
VDWEKQTQFKANQSQFSNQKTDDRRQSTALRGKLWNFSTGKMVGWWKFDQAKDNHVLDSSGNDLHGRLVGDAKIVSDPVRGNVLGLDGNGDYVNCGNNPAFDITGSITITAWIKANTFDARIRKDSGNLAVVTKGIQAAWSLVRNHETDNFKFYCKGLDVPSDSSSVVRGRRNENDGKWHHIAGVYDRRKMYLYVDGELDASASATGNINTNSLTVLIGENPQRRARE